MEYVFYSVLVAIVVMYIVAVVGSVVFLIRNIAKARKAKELLRINMIVKLIHVPAYLFIFLMGLGFTITIFTIGISVVLMILDGMTIFLTGMIGLGGVIRSLRESKLSKRSAVTHGILQFIFCADIISSIIIYRRVKNSDLDVE
jgi:hypothetical protein